MFSKFGIAYRSNALLDRMLVVNSCRCSSLLTDPGSSLAHALMMASEVISDNGRCVVSFTLNIEI